MDEHWSDAASPAPVQRSRVGGRPILRHDGPVSEILANYLGVFHGVLMALALGAAIAIRNRIRKRHLGWLVVATATAIVAFFGLLVASFQFGEMPARLIHAVVLPALAAAATGCGAVAGFTFMLKLFGLALRDQA